MYFESLLKERFVQLKQALGVGQSRIGHLFRITLPSIKNTLFVTLLLRVIWVANSVDIIQNMTAGGPAYATQTLGVYVYQTAHVLNLGYASAMAVMMMVVLLLAAVPYLRSTFKNEQ